MDALMVDDAELESEAAEAMDEDLPISTNKARQKISPELKERIQEVLHKHDFSNMRSAKLTQDDFLLLLSLFNKAGFHFA